MDIGQVVDRHERIALQFSGGKDSLACLYLLRPWLQKITVYWCDTGDTFPEVRAYMDKLAEAIPHFVVVQGRQPEHIAQFGWPAPVVPADYTRWGQMITGEKPFALQDRFQCCFHSMNIPMHNRMFEDGITLLIRGQRNSEVQKGPARSGDFVDGIEYFFPIQDWTEAEVLAYLEKEKAVRLPYTGEGKHSLDCMHCTGYQAHGQEAYLKEYHPELLKEYRRRIKLIDAAVKESLHG